MNLHFIHRFRGLVIFILLAALTTLIFGSIFVGVQQNYRLTANDPQSEFVNQISEAVKKGTKIDQILNPAQTENIDKSLSPFAAVFDKDGNAVASQAVIGENKPTPPDGVFEKARQHGENRFTWEPEKGTRVAAILKKFEGDAGFILVGRNLREVENRIKLFTLCIAIAWFVSILICALLAWILGKNRDHNLTIVEENIVIEEKPVEITIAPTEEEKRPEDENLI